MKRLTLFLIFGGLFAHASSFVCNGPAKLTLLRTNSSNIVNIKLEIYSIEGIKSDLLRLTFNDEKYEGLIHASIETEKPVSFNASPTIDGGSLEMIGTAELFNFAGYIELTGFFLRDSVQVESLNGLLKCDD